MKVVVGSVVWQLVGQSDAATWVILGILLLLSIVCWSIMVYKWGVSRTNHAELRKLLRELHGVHTVHDMHRAKGVAAHTSGAPILALGIEGMDLAAWNSRDVRDEWRNRMNHEVQRIMTNEEEYVAILKVAAEVSPLLGLLGTIWGLIHSFIGITYERVADIVTVAPGIAEALITTLAGLLVAIPALLFFTVIQRQLQTYETLLFEVVDRLEVIIDAHHRKDV